MSAANPFLPCYDIVAPHQIDRAPWESDDSTAFAGCHDEQQRRVYELSAHARVQAVLWDVHRHMTKVTATEYAGCPIALYVEGSHSDVIEAANDILRRLCGVCVVTQYPRALSRLVINRAEIKQDPGSPFFGLSNTSMAPYVDAWIAQRLAHFATSFSAAVVTPAFHARVNLACDEADGFLTDAIQAHLDEANVRFDVRCEHHWALTADGSVKPDHRLTFTMKNSAKLIDFGAEFKVAPEIMQLARVELGSDL